MNVLPCREASYLPVVLDLLECSRCYSVYSVNEEQKSRVLPYTSPALISVCCRELMNYIILL